MTKIYFDMDGTIADLYGEKNWLEKIKKADVSPYVNCKPLVDMKKLNSICEALIASKEVEIGIITWLAGGEKNGEYEKKVAIAKKEWIKKYLPCIQNFIAIPFGTPKHKAVKKSKKMILFDDNKEVREKWNTPKERTAYCERNIIETLQKVSV